MSSTQLTNREQLLEWIAAGNSPKYVFFWGHTPKVPGKVDASCLSNWFPAAFEVEGVAYPTSEHFMMAGKAKLFHDEEMLQEILTAKSPGAAKKFGRQVAGFDDAVWNAHRFEIVVAANVAKFGQHEALRTFLLETGNKILVEASPRDRVWGIGMGKTNPDANDPSKWKGLNLLGFALMEARRQLVAGCEPG